MARKIYSRKANGRFRKATLENTFGLKAFVCTECRAISTVNVGQAKPEKCHKCGNGELK